MTQKKVSSTSSNGPPRNYRGALEVDLKTCAKGTKLRVYKLYTPVARKGTISLTKTLFLELVLHVLNLSCNLLSISKLTKDLNCVSKVSSTGVVFQDLASGRTIGNAYEVEGLYYFDDREVVKG